VRKRLARVFLNTERERVASKRKDGVLQERASACASAAAVPVVAAHAQIPKSNYILAGRLRMASLGVRLCAPQPAKVIPCNSCRRTAPLVAILARTPFNEIIYFNANKPPRSARECGGDAAKLCFVAAAIPPSHLQHITKYHHLQEMEKHLVRF
jgi:hypothetical protein